MLNEMYSKLDLNDKRNELNDLLIKIDNLIDECADNNTTNSLDFPKVKNYDINNDCALNEEEMLSFIYEDLWNIKTKILYILMKKKEDENKNGTN